MPQLLLADVLSGSEVKNSGLLKTAQKTPPLETGFLAVLEEALFRTGNGEEASPETAAGAGTGFGANLGLFMGKTVDGPAPAGEKEPGGEPGKKGKTFFTGSEEATVMEGAGLAGLFPVPSPPAPSGTGETLTISGGQRPEEEQTVAFFRFNPENPEAVPLEEEPEAGESREPVPAVPTGAAPVAGPGEAGEVDFAPSGNLTKPFVSGTAEGVPGATAAVYEPVVAGGTRSTSAAGRVESTGEPETGPKATAGEEPWPAPAPKTAFFPGEGADFYQPPPDPVAGPGEGISPAGSLARPAGTRELTARLEKPPRVSAEPATVEALAGEKKQGAERTGKMKAGPVTIAGPAVENLPEEQETAGPVPRFLPPEKVFGQILQGARMMVKNGTARVRLELQPPELGRLELALVIEKETVTARFTAQSRTVQALIEANLPELRSNLQEAGLHVDQLQVEVENGFDSHSASGGLPREETPPLRKMSASFSPGYEEPEPETGEERWLGRINLRV